MYYSAMSEINTPSNVALQTGEGATRVTRTSTTSDDSSAQQQPNDKKPPAPEKSQEVKEKAAAYDTAVTISASLSNLEAGSKIAASYLGVDGQGRPLITSETGTYVVKYDPAHQQDIEKLPQKAVLEVKILKVDREIEARLIYQDPAPEKSTQPPLSIPVNLALTGLGNIAPKISASALQNQQPLEGQKISYQATNLYHAEHTARESANKLKELPLPATTTNYTLYEKATPQQNRPVIVSSSIAGNALIAQEQGGKAAASAQAQQAAGSTSTGTLATGTLATGTLATGISAAHESAAAGQANLEKLLHVNMLAMVIKNMPKATTQLPEIVQRQLGQTGPLDDLKAGHNFTLRIHSIAIPDVRPDTHPPDEPKSGPKSQLNNAPTLTSPSAAPSNNTVQPSPDSAPPPIQATHGQSTESRAAALKDYSGIVIAPGKNILHHSLNQTDTANIARRPNIYPAGYSTAAAADTPNAAQNSAQYATQNVSQNTQRGKSDGATLYVATPASVIKFQSPIDLKPGTVINFSLPIAAGTQTDAAGSKPDPLPAPLADARNTAKEANAGGDTAKTASALETAGSGTGSPQGTTTSLAGIAAPITTMETPAQPLESLTQNWRALSEIIAVLPPAADNSSHSLSSRLPNMQNPAQMTSGMIFFLAAMGAKNPARIWLGPAASQRLEKIDQGRLLSMLDNDMTRIFRLGRDSPVTDWRPALIPMQVGPDVQAIPILTRQVTDEEPGKKNNSEDDDDEKITATRFIVELTLSQFGKIQVDGLLKDKKLNIIIRSKIMLPSEMKSKMSGIFITALEISGYSGELRYRDNITPEISVEHVVNQKIHLFQS